MIVMKFGGTSVADAPAIRRAAAIVAGRLERRPLVVVSAMSGVTDQLLAVAHSSRERRFEEAAGLIQTIRRRHLETAEELLGGAVDAVWQAVCDQTAELESLARSVATLGELTPRSQDALVSFGERLSSVIVAAAFQAAGLPAEAADARALLVTNNRFTGAVPDLEETARRCRSGLAPSIQAGRLPVTQGFVGATLEGVTTTLGRGGSDYSAAIFGAALDAEAIEIWTDVDGMMTADPRRVPEARRVRVLSFAEASELSYFGAKVLHPSTVLPAVERGIPVHIYNSLNPSCEGTRIVAQPQTSANLIKSLASKRGITVVQVSSARMLQAYGFLERIFDTFARHETPVDVVTTSEVSVSMTIDTVQRLEAIEKELREIGEVTVQRERAIICVVGDNLRLTPGVPARVFRAIGPTVVHMISQGASEINLTFVIEEREVDSVLRALHAEFFSELDPATFA